MQILDEYFEALRSKNWEQLAACLSDNVHRTGPYCDVVKGKHAYVSFLEGIVPALANYELEVHQVRLLEDGSALVLLSESVNEGGTRMTFPEALVFDFDQGGLISRVDVYLKQPPRKRGSGAGDTRAEKVV